MTKHFCATDNISIMSHSKENLEHMQRDLIEEVRSWDLECNRQGGGQVRIRREECHEFEHHIGMLHFAL